jgi:hypothetical protein
LLSSIGGFGKFAVTEEIKILLRLSPQTAKMLNALTKKRRYFPTKRKSRNQLINDAVNEFLEREMPKFHMTKETK